MPNNLPVFHPCNAWPMQPTEAQTVARSAKDFFRSKFEALNKKYPLGYCRSCQHEVHIGKCLHSDHYGLVAPKGVEVPECLCKGTERENVFPWLCLADCTCAKPSCTRDVTVEMLVAAQKLVRR